MSESNKKIYILYYFLAEGPFGGGAIGISPRASNWLETALSHSHIIPVCPSLSQKRADSQWSNRKSPCRLRRVGTAVLTHPSIKHSDGETQIWSTMT